MSRLRYALLGWLTLAAWPALACDGLVVSDAWIAQAPPGAMALAGYAQIENRGDRPLRIDAVSGSDFGEVMLHTMREENGMLQMRMLDHLEVPAHGRVMLAPGGLHLMLMDPRRTFQAGDTTTLEFRCARKTSAAAFAVRAGQ
jgi:copper(I)-binding protein